MDDNNKYEPIPKIEDMMFKISQDEKEIEYLKTKVMYLENMVKDLKWELKNR